MVGGLNPTDRRGKSPALEDGFLWRPAAAQDRPTELPKQASQEDEEADPRTDGAP